MNQKDQNLDIVSVVNPDYSEQEEIDIYFQDCCNKDDLKEVKRLFRQKMKPSKISLGLQNACSKNNLEIVKYLTSEIKTTLNLEEVQECFVSACIEGHLEIIKYLVEDSKYKIDCHYKDSAAFKLACEFGRHETIMYLVFDLNFEKTEDVENYIKNLKFQNNSKKEDVDKLFNLRELNKNLNKELNSATLKERKIKI